MWRGSIFETLEQRRLLSFSVGGDYPFGAWPGVMVSADFNGDGRADLAVASLTYVDVRLGVAEANDVLGIAVAQTATFAGQTVDATSVLVKFTYGGDANLDGLVSGDDYSSIDFNIQTPGASGWSNGDFNYDGIISGDDYSVIDFNILAQGAPL